MMTQITMEELLKKAIEKEVLSQQLYQGLSKKVRNRAAKDALRDMVKQEKGHQTLLERYLRGELTEGALNPGQVFDYKIVQALDQPEISPKMKLKDVFLVAANRELIAHDFYLSLAQFHPAGQMKKLLEDLAAQELTHKQRVEYLYNEVAFPQTDGG